MKQNLSTYLSFALLAVFTAACSPMDDEDNKLTGENGDDVIRFAAPVIDMGVSTTPTRATLMNTVTPQTTFGVLGYCVPYQLGENTPDYRAGISEWLTKKELAHADVMYEEPIFYDGEKCVYTNHATDKSLPKRWYTPTAEHNEPTGRFLYTFIAYHPFAQTNGGFDVTPTDAVTKGIPKLHYTMPYPTGNDLTVPLDIDAAQDVMWATVFDHTSTQGAVTFAFKHLLTGLRFQINNLNTDAKKAVKIHNLAIEGRFYRVAEIDFKPADPTMSVTDDRYAGTFHFLQGANVEIAANTTQVIGANTPEDQGTAILLLPKFDAQAPSGTSSVPYLGSDKSIIITYSYPGDTQPTTKRIENFSLGRIPDQGTCYTLNLNFIGSEILLMFTADSIEYWEAGSDNEIIIN